MFYDIFFSCISDHSCSELISIWFCSSLKEAKAREGALERFIRFSERYSDTSSRLISAGVLFSTLHMFFFCCIFFGIPFLFVVLDLASLLPDDRYLSAGVCCEVENTMLYRTLILCKTFITRPGATPLGHSRHNIMFVYNNVNVN